MYSWGVRLTWFDCKIDKAKIIVLQGWGDFLHAQLYG